MTNLNALRDLEKRLAEAKGPDRDLDRDLMRACGFKVYPIDAPSSETYGDAWPVTRSLDSAIFLVERVLPGWFWTCGKCKLNAHATVGPDRDGPAAHLLADPKFDAGFDADMDHGVPALALCLACVRALIAQGEQ